MKFMLNKIPKKSDIHSLSAKIFIKTKSVYTYKILTL